MFHRDKTSTPFIHRGECTGRHLALIKMSFWLLAQVSAPSGRDPGICKYFRYMIKYRLPILLPSLNFPDSHFPPNILSI